MKIEPGTEFDTAFEGGNIALTSPDAHGNFRGIDSDGVEVEFNIVMVLP